MTVVREIPEGRTELGAEAMLALRPRHGTAEAIVTAIDTRLRPGGYRLVGAFDGPDGRAALAVAGFVEAYALSWGHHIYLADLSTLPEHRGAGHGEALMGWLDEEAARLGCDSLHLDSGVGVDRFAAHRLYMRHHMRIAAHHFQREL